MNTKPTILFVDDEERILRSLKMLFLGKYNIKTTTDANEALEILKNEKVHVVISDQRMPIMMGVDFLRQASQIAPHAMRLLLTGYSDLAAIVGSVNEGEIYRYVNKPWKADELKALVAEAADIAARLLDKPISTSEKTEKKVKKTPEELFGVLVLDTDTAIHQTVKKICSNNSAPVYCSSNIEHAFQILSEKEIAVMISEIVIEGQDVSAAIKTLKQYNPNILTIVLTSFQDTKSLIELINQGQVYRFLPKPIHDGLLGKSLQAALQRYQLLSNAPQLLMRHKVEQPSQPTTSTISDKVMSCLRKIRDRNPALFNFTT
jgi:DNA-binding NtrC family response regulator